MEKIINEEALLEDTTEGLANLLDIDFMRASSHINDEDMEYVMEKMFEAQSEAIQELARFYKRVNDVK